MAEHDADASAVFELDADALAQGLDKIAARFETVANVINATFGGANAQLAQTAASAGQISNASSGVATFAGWLTNAANACRLVATAFASITILASRLAPFVKYLPDSLGSWVPRLKAVAAEHVNTAAKVSLVTKGVAALKGQLTVLGAAFAVLEARQLGATRSAAAFGAAGALAMSKTIQGARGALGIIGQLAGAIARSHATAAKAATGGLISGLGKHAQTASMFLAPVAGMALALGPVGAAAAGVAAGFAGIKKSVAAAAETQSLQTSFITLLGSADAAKKRMAELSKFAASTPFEIPNISKASKVLQTLTNGALATGPGLAMVGDAAAVSGEPVDQLAVHIGRLWDGLQNGRAVGEALSRLQELGLVSSTTRAQIEALQAGGAKGAGVWKLAATDLARFSGEMKRQSGTWSGMMSNLSDSIGNIFRAFGTPVINSLGPFFAKLLEWMDKIPALAEQAGRHFAGWAALIAQAFSDGKITEVLGAAGKLGVMEWINYALSNLAALGSFLTVMLGAVARSFVSLLSACTTGQFWEGLANALVAAAAGFGAMLLEFVAKLLDELKNVPGIGDTAAGAAAHARQTASQYTDIAAQQTGLAGANLTPLFNRLAGDWQGALGKAVDAFKTTKAETGDVLDTSAARDQLARIIHPIALEAQKTIGDSMKAANASALPAPLKPGDPDAIAAAGNATAAGLQKIGGGGGFSIARADPLLQENKAQTGELKGMRSDIRQLREALTSRPASAALPTFG